MNRRKKNEQRPSYRLPDFEDKTKRQAVEKLYYDTADMATLFNVSARTLQRWRNEGVFPFKRIRGKIYYLKSKIDEYMEREGGADEDGSNLNGEYQKSKPQE
ncbi:helix-turn-helix domain-containing protein [Kaistella anthropi]|nr:helix-turn-helix domain-containing protein [Kaistella anthropi]